MVWTMGVLSILENLPEGENLAFVPQWLDLLGNGMNIVREAGSRNLLKNPKAQWPKFSEVMARSKPETDRLSSLSLRSFGKIAKADPSSLDFIQRVYPASKGGERGLLEGVLMEMGGDAAPLLDIVEKESHKEVDEEKRSAMLPLLCSLAQRSGTSVKKRLFDKARELLKKEEYWLRMHCYKSLGFLLYEPEDSLKILVEALEKEPVEHDGYPHLLLVDVIGKFGASGAKYAEKVGRFLHDEPWEVNGIGEDAILDALVAMGPAARIALPVVKEWMAKQTSIDEEGNDTAWYNQIYRKAKALVEGWSVK
jgi:hypothetical protein